MAAVAIAVANGEDSEKDCPRPLPSASSPPSISLPPTPKTRIWDSVKQRWRKSSRGSETVSEKLASAGHGSEEEGCRGREEASETTISSREEYKEK